MNERNYEEMAIGNVDVGFINDYKVWLQEKQLANSTSSQYLHDTIKLHLTNCFKV